MKNKRRERKINKRTVVFISLKEMVNILIIMKCAYYTCNHFIHRNLEYLGEWGFEWQDMNTDHEQKNSTAGNFEIEHGIVLQIHVLESSRCKAQIVHSVMVITLSVIV